MKKPANLFTCLTLLSLSTLNVCAESYATVDSNVGYGSVTTLDFANADTKLVDGNYR